MKLRKSGGISYWMPVVNDDDMRVRIGDEVVVVRDEDGLEVLTRVDSINPMKATVTGFKSHGHKVHPIDFPHSLLGQQLEIAQDEVIIGCKHE